MAILRICKYPESVLRAETKNITVFDEKLRTLTEDMAETMYDAPGIGLAAPQIGESLKLVVVDTTPRGGEEEVENQYMVMANPVITVKENSQIDEEGCLSLPELVANVKRYKNVTVTYQDVDGKECEIIAEDRFAVVLQHEIDHLNGILFMDHLSSLKRNLYKKKVKKWMSK